MRDEGAGSWHVVYLADIRCPLERANGILTWAPCHARARRGQDVTRHVWCCHAVLEVAIDNIVTLAVIVLLAGLLSGPLAALRCERRT